MSEITGIEMRVALKPADINALEALARRVAKGFEHIAWAMAEYRKALAVVDGGAAAPIPPEDRTL